MLGGMAYPTPLELQAFLPYACKKLGAHFDVRVVVRIQEEYISKLDTTKKSGAKSKITSVQASAPKLDKPEHSGSAAVTFLSNEQSEDIVVTAVMDTQDHLIEIEFGKVAKLPCLLLKTIGLCLPFHELFNKLIVRWSYLDGIELYEISKYLRITHLSELCLDGSPVAARNYSMLLEHPSNLKHLSLARCDLDDDDCIAICSKLIYPLPASRTLQVLNLTSNSIGDVGARAIGETLRSNRSLQYLNLSGNRVSDAGLLHILDSLKEFLMTENEIMDKRVRMMDYLNLRKEVYERCLRTVLNESLGCRSRMVKRGNKKSAERYLSLDAITVMTEALAEEQIGCNMEPFAFEETTIRNRQLYSNGNRSLCYLNVRFNNLGYSSVKNICKLLNEQSLGSSRFGMGLMRVCIEGNPLPELCVEYELIDEALEKIYKVREQTSGKRKSDRSSSKSKSQVFRSK